MSWSAQIRKGVIEFLALAVLEREETYGYALLKGLNAGQALQFTESSLYLALGRLAKAGLVESSKRPSPDGPARRYYTLTDDGRAHLQMMRVYWRSMASDIAALGYPKDEDDS